MQLEPSDGGGRVCSKATELEAWVMQSLVGVDENLNLYPNNK